MPRSSDVMYIDGEMWVRVTDCQQCRDIHSTFPIVRSFHSPICKAHGLCAACGGKLQYNPDAQFGYEIGSLCETCAG